MDIRYRFLAVMSVGVLSASASVFASTPLASVKLTQFKADPAGQTITVKLSNGLVEIVDLREDKVTVSAGGVQSTLSLNEALLQATNNDPQAASQLYSQLVKTVNDSSSVKSTVSNSRGGGGGGGIGPYVSTSNPTVRPGFYLYHLGVEVGVYR
ncbi:MAG: hypothetical protein L0H70_00075 [Xanthomonadales bacterium]|nr:hypothetical protein [Xanthomonadales bacterium]